VRTPQRYRSLVPPPPAMPHDDERRLRSLLRVLGLFQVLSLQIPVSMVEVFLLVAMNEGCSLRDLVQMSGRPQSSVSRQVLDAGETNRLGEPGLGLISWTIAPEELRRKQYWLTGKGRALLQRVLTELATTTATEKSGA
jgi:DNA-binding MarR family transcriptional regulator